MSIYNFLASLPALLGILGFVIYYVIRQHGKGDPATLKIVDKLRIDVPERFKDHSNLKSKQLFELLSSDNSLRSKISDQDFSLLQQTLKQQYIATLVVYSICTVLFLFGTGLFTYQINKPKPLNIENMNVSSTEPLAKGLAVDVDHLSVQWVSTGESEEIKVFIENMDTKERSTEFSVASDSGSVELMPDDYSAILRNREFLKWNRVRVVFQAQDESFYSNEFKLFVGATIIAVNFGEKVKIAAMIDNGLVQRYNFEALLVAWKNNELESISIGGNITNGQKDYPIENSNEYNWGKAKLAYLGPDDLRFIRTKIIYD